MRTNKLIYTQNAKIALCRKLISEDTVFFDTETTGLGHDAEIIEITILDISGGILFNQLIKPKGPIEEGAIAIHGITNEMVANAPSFDHFAPKIQEIFAGKNLVAHNIEYDKQRLIYEFGRLDNIKLPDVKSWNCTMLMNIHSKYQKRPKLIELAEEHGISFEGEAHRSHADTEVCRKILHSIAQRTLGLSV
jgi:DNA polymerase III epsilon subunit family exonuclease